MAKDLEGRVLKGIGFAGAAVLVLLAFAANASLVTVGGAKYYNSSSSSSSSSSSGGGGDGLEFFPLQLIQPHASGTGGMGVGSGLHPENRIFSAYPGLRYEIDIIAVGGAPPASLATVAITDGPGIVELYTANSGNQRWRYVWASPDTTDSVSISYTDRNGNIDTATWTITVSTSGFKFVDVSAGSNGSGTLASPFSAPSGVLDNARLGCETGDILYLRGGTYELGVADDNADTAFQVQFWESGQTGAGAINETCVQWIAYPGETVIVDGGYAGSGFTTMLSVNFESFDAPPYFDGITFLNFKDKAVFVGLGDGVTTGHEYGFRRIIFDGLGPSTAGGNNNGSVSFPQGLTITQRSRGFFVDCIWRNIDNTENALVKFYSVDFVAVHDNLVENVTTGSEADGIAYKADIGFVSEIGNVNTSATDTTMFMGNQNEQTHGPMTFELAFNNYQREDASDNYVIGVNHSANTSEGHIFNNTFRGRIHQWHANTGNGPFDYQRNVIVNSQQAQTPWPYLNEDTGSVPSLVTQTDELFGHLMASTLDANGNLQGADLTNHGPSAAPEDRRGHMVDFLLPLFGVALRGRRRYRSRTWHERTRVAA